MTTTEQPTNTVHLPTDIARLLLIERGWTIEDDGSYTRPGGTSRNDNGNFGPDWLWDREEALTLALTASGEKYRAFRARFELDA